jgi:predicted nucleic-acid-binding Zn-ribbon protein
MSPPPMRHRVFLCVKCGNPERPKVRYCSERTHPGLREWLEHTCTDCGYRWTEPTRDAA